MDNDTAQELIKALLEGRRRQQEDHAQTQALLRETVALLNGNARRIVAPQPAPPGYASPVKPAKLTADALVRNEAGSLDLDSFQAGSVFSTDDALSVSDDAESWHVQEPLAAEEYDEEGLKAHIAGHRWQPAAAECLEGLEDPAKHELLFKKENTIFPTALGASPDKSHLTHYSIFNVGQDGAPMQVLPPAGSGPTSRSLSIWNRIKATNVAADRQKAVGRITIVREPSPLLFAALHYTHQKHFDMDELLALLVDDDPTLVRTPDAFADKDTHQRSFAITFEYFTLVEPGCEPMAWQHADLATGEVARRHIPISRCSSVVALSLEGDRMGRVTNKKRGATKRHGNVYDPFAPWRVLNIQCYPDQRASLDSHDSTKHYVNGPEAFLVTLCAEYKDAVQRLLEIHKAVAALVKPPSEFIFSLATRDALLFEDKDFTYSRRYFWAYNTLGVMNEDIENMMTSYHETFKESVWDGTDKMIWPGSPEATASAKHINWRRKMKQHRAEIEQQMDRLREMHKMNEDRKKYVKNLHNNLFNGTSVLESRRSVEMASITVNQGRNIKLLTLVTIFFLPLTFVTSVYGMTNMPQNDSFYRFGWSTLAICVPTYILIGSLNTDSGMKWWQRQVARFIASLSSISHALAWVLALFGWKPKWTEHYHRMRREPKDLSTQTQPEFPPVQPRRTRHMSNDLASRDNLAARETFQGMPVLSNKATIEREDEKDADVTARLDRMHSDQTVPGAREQSFKPGLLRIHESHTGSPPPHRPSIGVVPIHGQQLPPAFAQDTELEKARRRGTMMSIASHRTIKEKNEDALSVSSSGSSDRNKGKGFLQKMWFRRRDSKKDDYA